MLILEKKKQKSIIISFYLKSVKEEQSKPEIIRSQEMRAKNYEIKNKPTFKKISNFNS